MIDLEYAKQYLAGNTISLYKDGVNIISSKKGITPMMECIEKGVNLCNFSVADMVVGKAVAFLFIKAQIKSVYAKIISKPAMELLSKFKIPYEYETEVPYIINRQKTGVCPMESTVIDVEDVDEAYMLLKNKLKELNSKNENN